MTKREILGALEYKLYGLPRQEVEERIGFYAEMIDDRMEEGSTEEEAVAQMGPVEKVAEQIIADIPLVKIVAERIIPKQRSGWEIALLIIGFPLWFPLLIAAFAIWFAFLAVIGALVVSVWAVFIALCASVIGGVLYGIVLVCMGHALSGAFLIGAGVFCTGLAIFTFYGCKFATKGFGGLVKKVFLAVKKGFVKEAKQ